MKRHGQFDFGFLDIKIYCMACLMKCIDLTGCMLSCSNLKCFNKLNKSYQNMEGVFGALEMEKVKCLKCQKWDGRLKEWRIHIKVCDGPYSY